MNKILKQFGDSFLDDHSKGQGFSDTTNNLFSEWITTKMASIMNDEHDRKAVVNETHLYLHDLLEECNNVEDERKFFNTLSESTNIKKCNASSLHKCAEKLVEMDKPESIFNELERVVGLSESGDDDDKSQGVPGWKEESEGRIVKNKDTGCKGVVIRSSKSQGGGKDVVVNPMKGSKVLKNATKMWHSGTYEEV